MVENKNAPGRKAEGVVCLHRHADIDANSTKPAYSKGTLSLGTWKRDPAELLEEQLYAQRNRWDLNRRRSGLHLGERRIGTDEAGRLLTLALATLKGGV